MRSCAGDAMVCSKSLGEPSIAIEPRDGPLADPTQSILQLVPGIAAISDDVAQPGKRCRISASTSGAPSRS